MLRALACLVISLAVPAAAVAGPVQFRSTGRPVDISIGDQRCTTPCSLDLEAGLHRARVDGLDRQIDAGAGEVVVVRPTRRRLLGIGIALASAGAVGLGLAGSWALRLDGRTRLISAGAGLSAMFLAIPLITGSSARVLRPRPLEAPAARDEIPERFIAAIGITSELAFGVSAGYQLAGSRLALGVDLRETEALARAEVRIARLPIVSVRASAGAGIDLTAAIAPLGEVAAALQIELPGPIKPRVEGALQALRAGGWSGRAVARAALAFEL